MNAIKKRPVLRKAVAMGLFVFGVVGLVLPLLPGWLLIGFGLYLMSIDSPAMQAHIHRYRTKYPSLHHVLRHSYDRLHKETSIPKVGEDAKLAEIVSSKAA